jgi:hypothetical protein
MFGAQFEWRGDVGLRDLLQQGCPFRRPALPRCRRGWLSYRLLSVGSIRNLGQTKPRPGKGRGDRRAILCYAAKGPSVLVQCDGLTGRPILPNNSRRVRPRREAPVNDRPIWPGQLRPTRFQARRRSLRMRSRTT